MKYNLLNQVGQWELIADNPCCQSFCQLLNSHWRWKWSGKGGSDSEWSGSMINQIASEVWCQLNHQRGRGGFFLCLNKCQWFSGFGATDDLDTQVDGGCPFTQLCNQRCNEHKNNAILGKNAHNSTVSAKTGFPFKYSSPACKRRQSQQLDWWGDDTKTPQICGLSIVCPDLYRYHIWQWLKLLEEGRDAHNITANAASRFSVESALEKERWHKILQPIRSS